MERNLFDKTIAVIGLGYVGLPLAIEFSKKTDVIGFDLNKKRIEELSRSIDSTKEVTSADLLNSSINFSYESSDLDHAEIYIVTVPTPIDHSNQPDLSHLESASLLIGNALKRGDLVIYESTVYPGATEEFCIPILERVSNLTINEEFYCGYSPERINPGDKQHSVTDILKLTSGSNEIALEMVDGLYSEIINAGTFRTQSIKIAEAAKVIENTQRDLNIALVNELSLIFNKLEIDTNKVLEAASTKWNFNKFYPGLVGGHCIGVDPYYLTFKAQQIGYIPEIILAGRRVNNRMAEFVADETVKLMLKKNIEVLGSSVLVLGAAFKEDCPDIRNSKVFDLIKKLEDYGIKVDCFDPIVSDHSKLDINIPWINGLSGDKKYDAIILAVPHSVFLESNDFLELGNPISVIYDIKGVLPEGLVDGRL